MPKTMNSNVQIRVNTDLEVGSEFKKTNHRSKNEDRSEAERRRREQIEKREYGSARSETMDDGGVIELQSEVLVLRVSTRRQLQELAKGKISTVPTRYIQSQHEELVINKDDHSILEIPIIDMKKLLSLEFENSELSKLHLACKDWGFFQLVNHGVSSSLVEKVKLETQDFFNLPMSEKKKFWQTPKHMEGFGQAFVMSDEQKLDWADIFFMSTLPKHSRMPHLFPKLPLPIRDTFELYSMELQKLSMVIVEYMGKALKMDENEMRMLFEDGIQSMRMNYYPPCPQPEKVIGLTPHSDGSALTILLQLNDVQGLQVRKDGNWVPVKPLPNAFIVNIGDILEIITNGIYRSIEHRATVNSEKERISIATFYTSKHDGEIGPAKSLINEVTPARFKRIGLKEYLKNLFARKLDGKSFLDSLRI
ncbi:protein SRG1 [Trifolium repens]|nr:protein SRG1 [Trifolium repens]